MSITESYDSAMLGGALYMIIIIILGLHDVDRDVNWDVCYGIF